MEQLNIILLGVLQGVTEFLPISSSAHLVIAQEIIALPPSGLMLEIILHLGTLVSILIYFRWDLRQLVQGFFQFGEAGAAHRRELALLVIATLPAVSAALIAGDLIGSAFSGPARVGFSGAMLLVTSAVLLSTYWIPPASDGRLTWRIALVVGTAQALALLPGISRSGITISVGLWLGLGAQQSARFSFLMAIPAILGAGLFQLLALIQHPAPIVPGLLLSFLVAAGVGYAMLRLLIQILQRGRLYLFAIYTSLAGLVLIF